MRIGRAQDGRESFPECAAQRYAGEQARLAARPRHLPQVECQNREREGRAQPRRTVRGAEHRGEPAGLAEQGVSKPARGGVTHADSRSARWRRAIRLGAVAMTLALVAACGASPPNQNPRAELPLKTVPVDLPRYMGKWYVIANIPYFGERGNVASYAEWVLRDDGRIDDHYVYRPGSFDAPTKRMTFLDTPVPGSGGGEWRVRLFWPVTVQQLTLYVDPDYRVTLLGYPARAWAGVCAPAGHGRRYVSGAAAAA